VWIWKKELKAETHDTFLHGQLQEELRMEIVCALVVSEAQSYVDLCVSAKNEQHRQIELQKQKMSRNERAFSQVPRTGSSN